MGLEFDRDMDGWWRCADSCISVVDIAGDVGMLYRPEDLSVGEESMKRSNIPSIAVPLKPVLNLERQKARDWWRWKDSGQYFVPATFPSEPALKSAGSYLTETLSTPCMIPSILQ